MLLMRWFGCLEVKRAGSDAADVLVSGAWGGPGGQTGRL